jgi:ketosteroid isomerase-like protein
MVRNPRQWTQAYERAWQEADPAAAGALFTEDATYQVTPFSEVMRGRAAIEGYWREVTDAQEQRDITCRWLGEGPDEHFVHFRAELVVGEEPATLDGVLAVTLDGSGTCTALREWWHRDAEGDL